MKTLEQSDLRPLIIILASLRALKWSYWNSHWMSKGQSYYGDHLLFERLYTEIDPQIDTMAEKITAYNPSILDSDLMIKAFDKMVNESKSQSNLVQRGLDMEAKLQHAIEYAYNHLKQGNNLSLGMDDFLMATANDRETVIYLLQQRIR